MTTVAAPVIVAEMADWVALGGGNSGIIGDPSHTYGFHKSAEDVPASDYSRRRDPNGADGPFVNWEYACAGDFRHGGDPDLRAMHREVLARLMRGELPMICEFIGKPWADRPVYYWARWNGIKTLQRYTGAGHDPWSHVAWYRSRVDERAHLWSGGETSMIGLRKGDSGERVKALQSALREAGHDPGEIDGDYGPATSAALLACRKAQGSSADSGDWVSGWAHTQLVVAIAKRHAGKDGAPGKDGKPGEQGPPGPPGQVDLPAQLHGEVVLTVTGIGQ